MNNPPDVPSPIDLQNDNQAREWENTATSARPWRNAFFECITANLGHGPFILELGSGPGFLAEHILRNRADVHTVLLDFSAPMHRLASERLAAFVDHVTFVHRSFNETDWSSGLGPFDHVVTNQAVHELRHKRYATQLHAAVRVMLKAGGTYLVSDHYAGDDGMKNRELYMTPEEQETSLRAAGFGTVSKLLQLKGMVLHRAQVAPVHKQLSVP